MEISIRGDFGGPDMKTHQPGEDLVEGLDHGLGQLDQGFGFEYFDQHNPAIDEDHILLEKRRYGELGRCCQRCTRDGDEDYWLYTSQADLFKRALRVFTLELASYTMRVRARTWLLFLESLWMGRVELRVN